MENLEITIVIDGFALLNDAPADGLLAKLWFERLKERGEFDGDYGRRLPFLELDVEGFYRVSRMHYTVVGIDNRTLFKGFDAATYMQMPGARYSKQLDQKGKGPYKIHMAQHERQHVGTVTIHARGDGEVIADLLTDLKFLGKKGSQGWGEIRKIRVAEIGEDLSVVTREGALARHVPAGSRWLSKATKPYAHRLRRLVHPYWETLDRTIVAENIWKGEARGSV